MDTHDDTLEPAAPRGRRMRVVTRDGLLESVSTAVEGVLVEYSGLPLAARLKMRREIQRRFLALSLERARRVRGLTRAEALRDFEHAHATLTADHAEMRKELAELEGRLEGGRASGVEPAPTDADALGRVLTAELEELLGTAPAARPAALERLVARERARRELAIEQALTAERGKADLLERRVAKMRAELATMERTMAELERRAAVDGGIASIYKGVQGLAAGENERDVKQALMHQIFAANLALQRRETNSV